MRIPKGHPGSWFAEWEGEKIPCVHLHATVGIWPRYLDPKVDDRGPWPAFIAAISEGKRVLLTTSYEPDDKGIRRRKKYQALWRVEDVTVQDGRLEFTFVELLKRFGPNK